MEILKKILDQEGKTKFHLFLVNIFSIFKSIIPKTNLFDFREDTDQRSRETITATDNIKIFESILNLDRFQIKMHMNRYSIEIHQDEVTERLRMILKKVVIEEILKAGCENSNFYRVYLKETIDSLAIGSAVESGYLCSGNMR